MALRTPGQPHHMSEHLYPGREIWHVKMCHFSATPTRKLGRIVPFKIGRRSEVQVLCTVQKFTVAVGKSFHKLEVL